VDAQALAGEAAGGDLVLELDPGCAALFLVQLRVEDFPLLARSRLHVVKGDGVGEVVDDDGIADEPLARERLVGGQGGLEGAASNGTALLTQKTK
jgi:hypothetical protein